MSAEQSVISSVNVREERPFLTRLRIAASKELIIIGGTTAGSGAVLFVALLDRTSINPAVTIGMVPVGMLVYSIGKMLEVKD